MEKSTTLNIRVDSTLKSEVETTFTKKDIPFSVELPKPPVDIDISQMTETQLYEKIQRGYNDYKAGMTQNASDEFVKFRESHSNR